MLDYVTLDDAGGAAVSLHGGATAALVSADGLVGLPGVREAVRPRPNGHGSINRTRRLSDRVITLKGEVWGGSAAGAYAEFDKLQAALYGALEQARTLRYRRGGPDGLELQTDVRLASDVKAPLAGLSRFITWEVQLRADDPRAYTQEVFVARSAPYGASGGGADFPTGLPLDFVPGSSGIATFTTGGSAPTPPIYRVHGRLVNPIIRLGTEGPDLVLNGTVASGDFLELDVAAKSVLLNGRTNRLYMRDYALSRWAELPARSSLLVRLLADEGDPDAYLEVFYRHAF